MESLYEMQISVPVIHVLILLSSSTLALIFGRLKLALLINYCFTMYWGFLLNSDLLIDGGKLSLLSYAYVGFGLLIIFLALVGFLVQKD